MEIYSGFLTVKSPSLIKPKTYHRVWSVLYSGRSTLNARIDLYQDSASVSYVNCKKTIYIEEAKWKKIDSLEPAFSFEVKHSKQYIFICASLTELKAWVLHLCCISGDLFSTKHIIGLHDGSKMDAGLINYGEECVVKDNVLYSSSRDLETYNVIADENEGCQHLGLKGMYRLTVESSIVRLLYYDSDKEIVSWSLHDIRNFGHSTRTFFVNAGSRCRSGEGKFIFHTAEGEKIVASLSRQAERLRNNGLKSEPNSSANMAPKPPAKPFSPAFGPAEGAHDTSDAEKKKVSNKPQLAPKPRLSGSGSQEEVEGEYRNLHQQLPPVPLNKNRPAPGPPASPRENSQLYNHRIHGETTLTEDTRNTPGGGNPKFLETLDERMGDPRISLTRSVSSQSSESGSKRDSKKSSKEQKKEKKEKKKREEEEKRERKRREEEEKRERKRKEEEEKKKEKEIKKEKTKLGKTWSGKDRQQKLSLADAASHYSEADEFASSGSPPSYTEVSGPATEKIYCEPWQNSYHFVDNPHGSGGKGVKSAASSEVIYSEPQKKTSAKPAGIEGREIIHTENYEDVQSVGSSHGSAPPLITPIWLQDTDDSNNNVYDHMHQEVPKTSQENVYGMASASAPFSPTPEENPYEDTGGSYTYEQVAM